MTIYVIAAGDSFLCKGGGQWIDKDGCTVDDIATFGSRSEAECEVRQLHLHPEYIIDQQAYVTEIDTDQLRSKR